MKTTSRRTPHPASSPAPAPGPRPARPFTVPLEAAPAGEADPGSLVERASRFGHSLERLAASRPPPRGPTAPSLTAPIQAFNGHADEEDGNQGQQNQPPLMLTMEPWEQLESTWRAAPWSSQLPGPRQLLDPHPIFPTPLGPSSTGIVLSGNGIGISKEEIKSVPLRPSSTGMASPGNGIGISKAEIESMLLGPSSTGMASPESRERLTSKGSNIAEYLKKKKLTPDKLRELHTTAVNSELARVEAPKVASTFTNLPIPDSLDEKSWTLKLSQTSFSDVDPVKRISLAMNSFAHESRHAEQRFRVARLLASGGATAEQIREQTGLPEHVVTQAVEKPLQVPPTGRTREMHEAEVWYHSFYGQNASKRNQIVSDYHEAIQEVDNQLRYHQMASLYGTNEERETTRKDLALARSVYDAKHDKYRSLPDEVDAWELGDDIGRRIRG